jgi:hypothetical protein
VNPYLTTFLRARAPETPTSQNPDGACAGVIEAQGEENPAISSNGLCGRNDFRCPFLQDARFPAGKTGGHWSERVDRLWIDEEDFELSENQLEEISRGIEGGGEWIIRRMFG